MTLKQSMLIKELPNCEFNIAKAGRRVGYRESYLDGELQKRIRNNGVLDRFYSEEGLKKDIKSYLKRLKKEKDNTNFSRMMELRSKVAGIADKSQIDLTSSLKPALGKEELLKRVEAIKVKLLEEKPDTLNTTPSQE